MHHLLQFNRHFDPSDLSTWIGLWLESLHFQSTWSQWATGFHLAFANLTFTRGDNRRQNSELLGYATPTLEKPLIWGIGGVGGVYRPTRGYMFSDIWH